MRNTRLVLSSALLSLAVAACGGDAPLDGSFSNVTLEERDGAIDTAAGAPLVVGAIGVLFADFASVDPNGCVGRTEEGDTVTLTGRGCQPSDGELSFAGSAVVRGYADFVDDDAADQMTIEFDGFSMDSGDGPVVVDGTVEVDQAADGSGETIISLSLEAAGARYELHATLACEASPGTCHYRDAVGSTSAVGEFAIEGTYREGTGRLELIGDQRMVVDFDAARDNCAPVEIDGQKTADFCKADDEE